MDFSWWQLKLENCFTYLTMLQNILDIQWYFFLNIKFIKVKLFEKLSLVKLSGQNFEMRMIGNVLACCLILYIFLFSNLALYIEHSSQNCASHPPMEP